MILTENSPEYQDVLSAVASCLSLGDGLGEAVFVALGDYDVENTNEAYELVRSEFLGS